MKAGVSHHFLPMLSELHQDRTWLASTDGRLLHELHRGAEIAKGDRLSKEKQHLRIHSATPADRFELP